MGWVCVHRETGDRVQGIALSMTLQLDSGQVTFVAPGDTWRFLRGAQAPSIPADAWKDPYFDDSGLEQGPTCWRAR